MSEHQLPLSEQISNTQKRIQGTDVVKWEKKETEPVKDAFLRCSQVFKSDKSPENSIQNIEKFFDD